MAVAGQLHFPPFHFVAGEYDELLAQHGTLAIWRKAMFCACYDRRSGRVELDCPSCDRGVGVVWRDPEVIKVLLPGRARHEAYDMAGAWERGIVNITFPSRIVPGHYDRVDLLVGKIMVNNERHERGEVDRAGRSTERVRQIPVQIEKVEAFVGGASQEFDSGFSLGLDGSIIWAAGPPDGSRYTVRYEARPAFVVWGPQSRDEFGNKMPYKVKAQRLDFFAGPTESEEAIEQ